LVASICTAKMCGGDSDRTACVKRPGRARFKESRKHAGSTRRCQIFSIRLVAIPRPAISPLSSQIAHSPRSRESALGLQGCTIACYDANVGSSVSRGSIEIFLLNSEKCDQAGGGPDSPRSSESVFFVAPGCRPLVFTGRRLRMSNPPCSPRRPPRAPPDVPSSHCSTIARIPKSPSKPSYQ
jgi:hypothetical protein